jgi:hypothetical protein
MAILARTRSDQSKRAQKTHPLTAPAPIFPAVWRIDFVMVGVGVLKSKKTLYEVTL